jgi:hypothetical protein
VSKYAVNSWVGCGNLIGDPEIMSYTTKDGGEGRAAKFSIGCGLSLIPMICWRDKASDNIMKYLKKGDMVVVQGQLRLKWDKIKKRFDVHVAIENMTFPPKAWQEAQATGSELGPDIDFDDDDESIPF